MYTERPVAYIANEDYDYDMENRGSLKGHEIRGYQLRSLIGAGGFAEVYRAYQPAVGRDVAVKIILPANANRPSFIRRFEAEAQLVARLEHIHIVPLYDFWREPDGAYLVMRWLKGGSLRRLLAQGLPLETEMIARILVQITSALATAHRSGIVHQDIKPDNILLDEVGNAYLADFGIAKDLKSNMPEGDDFYFGTPVYTAPEQVLNQVITPQTDIYSLGIMFFELLTGRPPFGDTDETALFQKHVKDPLPSLQTIQPDLPRQLSVVLWRACAKQPSARYPDVMTFATEFLESLPDGVLPALQSTRPFLMPSDVSRDTAKLVPDSTVMLQQMVTVQNPFKGLRPFQEADTADFFGREALVEHLLGILDNPTTPTRLLTVIGPSGSGKSSAIRAGLIPALRRGMLPGSETWFIAQMTPGDDPFKALEAMMLQVAVSAPPSLLDWLKSSDQGLLDTVKKIVPMDNVQVVLFIDQFEEVFTLVEDESVRRAFLMNLYEAATHPESPLRIILALRADYYDRPLLYTDFGALVRAHTEVVLPLSPAELELAIAGPAERAGLQIERGLVPAIVASVSHQPGALPLLQYALTELFERRKDDVLTLESYHEIGGIAGALARRAETVYEELDEAAKGAARQLFLQIVAAGDGMEEVRRRVTLRALLDSAHDEKLMQQVIDVFGRYRLLAFDREPETRMPTIEIAHEALIREWRQLREWLDSNRDDLRMYRRLAVATTDWVRADRDSSYLARGSRLAQFTALAEAGTVTLNDDEKAFVQASIALRQQTINRLRAFVSVLVIALLATLILAGIAINREQQAQRAEAAALAERDRADQQARISQSRELAITALTEDQPDLSLLLSLEALRAAQTFEARSSLLSTLQAEPRQFAFLHGHTDAVRAVAWRMDGTLVASGGRDTTIQLWSAETRQPAGAPLTGHEDWINALAFDPGGGYLASASADGTVRLWDVEAGEQIQVFTDEDAPVWGLAFSADGAQIAASTAAGGILRWEVETGELIGEPLVSHQGIVYGVAFSADGQWLASVGDDNTVRLWRLDGESAKAEEIITHDNWVLTAAFSPDSSILASAGADGMIVLWDMQNARELHRITSGHNDWIRHLTFDPLGYVLASAGADGSVRLWDVPGGISIAAPFQHDSAVWSAAFDPSGELLAAADESGHVILWDVIRRYTLDRTLGYHAAQVFSATFSPVGRRLVTAGGDPTQAGGDNALHLWTLPESDNAQPEQIFLEGHSGPVIDVTFSPDGTRIASGGADGRVMLWNGDTGEQFKVLTGDHGSINAVAFSPDGAHITGAADDGSVLIWDTDGEHSERLKASDVQLYALAYSPDASRLAVGSQDGVVTLLDASSGEVVGAPLAAHTDVVTTLAFSPDARLLATGSRDRTVILWDANTLQPVGSPLVAHTNWVLSLDFSPDGILLATGSRDGTLILWDVATGRALGNPMVVGSGDWVQTVTFSADGTSLVTGSRDGAVILWDASLTSWEDRACRISNRNLTPAEQLQYLGESSPEALCG